MAQSSIPRGKIPWFPTIDKETCTDCQVCLEYCQHAVYALNEEAGRVEVRRPYECVVGCTGCEDKCAAGAISFPDMYEIAELLRKLRNEP